MTPADRDPRIDSRPGDVLRVGLSVRRVNLRHGAMIYCTKGQPGGHWSIPLMPNIHQWRKWARSAEVVHAAE